MVDDEDKQLFLDAVGPVERLTHDRVAPPAKRRKPAWRPAPTEDDTASLSDAADQLALGDILEFRRPGVQNRMLSRLRQGHFPIERELDLHGQTAEQARQLLPRFLSQAQRDGLRCVIVVHGKGYRSPDQKPVLKSLVNHWLPQCREVLAYCSAQPAHGGTGAVYVLLRMES